MADQWQRVFRRGLVGLGAAALVAAGQGFGGSGAQATAAHVRGDSTSTYVYTLSNQIAATGGNAVLGFRTTVHGLAPIGRFPTGGVGTGKGLGSQGALVVTDEGSRLIAVNAGSNTVSAFSVGKDGRLTLINSAASGGLNPISVTAHNNQVFVLNAGDNTVSGLRLTGHLTSVAQSTRPLSVGAKAPVQVSLTPNGRALVITEKASDSIDVFPVRPNGALGAVATTVLPAGTTPFGFDFDGRGHAVVSDAAGGAANASSVSSFTVSRSGILRSNGAVADGQTAACWVVVDRSTNRAYTTNTGSGSVSSYDISARGQLTLHAQIAAATGGHPLDEILGGHRLFVLLGAEGQIVQAPIRASGELGPVVLTVKGLPLGTTGLATLSDS